MRSLQSLPIRQKLVLITTLTTGGALLLAGGGLVVFDAAQFKEEMVQDLQILTEIVAENITAALVFDDRTAASETLRALRARKPIVAAAVYDLRGRLFASYKEGNEVVPPRPAADGYRFRADGLEVFRHVELEGETIGTVYLRSNRDELVARVGAQVIAVVAVLLASGILALLFSSGLQRLVSSPILNLAQTARAVSEHKDYTLRAEKRSADELGRLVDAFNDMLDQIQARDSELLRSKQELEERVRERTRELQQELAERQRAERELEIRNEELHQSNKELDDFAYIASHDLKEPLRGIHNFSSFLLEDYADKLDAEGQAKLATLTRLSRRMEVLIDSLLHYSRLGRVDLAIAQVDLNGIVEEVLDSLAIALKENRVEVRIPRPLPVVRCDRARVGEIFYNLVVNAIKYNDKPQKWIEIGVNENGAQPGEPRVFYVRDNGIGIPEKHYESVFRIFKRLHGREKYNGGTGAGLTIARKIVERHHGRIWLDSSAGEGTTFYFTLEEGDVLA